MSRRHAFMLHHAHNNRSSDSKEVIGWDVLCSRYLRNRKHVPCFYRVIKTRVEV